MTHTHPFKIEQFAQKILACFQGDKNPSQLLPSLMGSVLSKFPFIVNTSYKSSFIWQSHNYGTSLLGSKLGRDFFPTLEKIWYLIEGKTI